MAWSCAWCAPTAAASIRCALSAPATSCPPRSARRVRPDGSSRVPALRLDSPWLRNLVAAGAGALLACAFAPLQLWPLAMLCPAVLMWLLEGESPRAAAARGFWFNVGTFAAGTYWLYISIHLVARAPTYQALVLMLGLVAIMGLYGALLGYVVARWLPATGAPRWLLGIPAAWLLSEWWRGWFLTGFAWLSLGYSQTDTALA